MNGGNSPYRPRGCDMVQWKDFHMQHHGGLSVRRAAAQYQRKSPVARVQMGWDDRSWQAGTKLRPQHTEWTEVHFGELAPVVEQCGEGAGFYNGTEVIQCNGCFAIAVPKRQPGLRGVPLSVDSHLQK